jgi:hypothetical protein
MDEYSRLLTSQEYANFIKENADYAKLMNYNVGTERGLTEAMSDQFLFEEFLDEQNAVV